MADTAKKVRLSLDLNPQLNERLDRLAAEQGVTKADILRRALALFDVTTEAARKGKKVGVAGPDTTLETEFVGL